jgi:hypothetical protein
LAFIPPSYLILPKRVVCPDEVIEYLKNQKPLNQVEKLIPDTTESPYNFGSTGPILGVKNPL